ncbi:hypothetical protein ACFLT7_02550 [candidate division KSB1 bacterium]
MLARRLWRHFTYGISLSAGLAGLKGKLQSGNTLVCLSVDGDGGGNPKAIPVGCRLLFDIFDRLGLRGRVTWFINADDGWTGGHGALLERIIGRNDAVEQHTHMEKEIENDDLEVIESRIGAHRRELEDFCRTLRPDYKILGFRSGRLRYSPNLFAALGKLGFLFDSSVSHLQPDQALAAMRKEPEKEVTTGASLLAPVERIETGAPAGPLLEIPVWEPFPSWKWLATVATPPIIITNLIHPFNLVTQSGRPNRPVVEYYTLLVRLLGRMPNVEFTTLRDAVSRWT